jgi:glycosyltransferase involved in cell wall biosynthesis
MNLLITAMSAATGPSEISRHVCNLVRCAVSRKEILRITLVIGKWQEPFFQSVLNLGNTKLTVILIDISNDAYTRNLWHLRELPDMAEKVAADLVHLSFPVPIRRGAIKCPVVISLHDLYPYDEPDNLGFPTLFFNRVFLQRCLREVDCVVCASETTFARLKERFPYVAHGKAIVIYNCVHTSEDEVELPMIAKYQFILMVAEHRANKNISLALEVFENLLRGRIFDEEVLLLLVGNHGSETTTIKSVVARRRLEENVRLMDGVSDPQLKWLFTHCKLLIAPSWSEGFGSPVLEGRFCGSRIVCSDIPSFREIGGDACQYFDLHARSVSSAMTMAICNAMAEPARTINVPERFLPENVAGEYLALYMRLVRNG